MIRQGQGRADGARGQIQCSDGQPSRTSPVLYEAGGGSVRMRKFLRLIRYGVPYTFQWVLGVMLLAVVGALDTFRVLLLQPVFDQVLQPNAPEGPITLG